MSVLKVAHILECSGGGVGRHAIDVVTALAQDERFEVHLIHAPHRMDARYRQGLENLGKRVKVHEIPMVRQISPRTDWQGLWDIYHYLRQQGPFAAVHVHSSKAGAIGSLAARLAGVATVVFTPHAFYSMGLTGRKRQVYQAIERLCAALCHHLIAVSPQEKDYIVHNRLAPRQKVKVVPNAIEPPNLAKGAAARQRLRHQWGLEDGTRLIGSIGRMTAQKDPLTFVELVARRAERYEAAAECYLMAGDGDLEPEVKAAIQRLGLGDRLHYLGFRADVDDLMAALDVYVLHSRYEGMPYIVLEAMGHGLPIVSTAVAGVTDPLCDGGLLVPVGDVAALDSALDRLVADAQRQTLGQANRRRLENYYSIGTMMAALGRLYSHKVPKRSLASVA